MILSPMILSKIDPARNLRSCQGETDWVGEFEELGYKRETDWIGEFEELGYKRETLL